MKKKELEKFAKKVSEEGNGAIVARGGGFREAKEIGEKFDLSPYKFIVVLDGAKEKNHVWTHKNEKLMLGEEMVIDGKEISITNETKVKFIPA